MTTAKERWKETVAYHEAGHAFMAWRLHVKIRKVTIVSDKYSAGHVAHHKVVRGRYPENDDSPRTERRMQNLMRICLAGVVAQRIHNPRSVRSYHGSADRHEEAEIALHLSGGNSDAAYFCRKWNRKIVEGILSNPTWWRLVEALAQQLLRVETMDGEAVRKFFYDVMTAPRGAAFGSLSAERPRE